MKVSVQRYKALDRLESELPAQLIHIGRTFTRHALWVMGKAAIIEENNHEGFIFSLSKRQLAKKLGCSEGTAQNWTVMAVAIGIVTRLNEEESAGTCEYRGESGIGVQQYAMNKINLREVRKNWRIWTEHGLSVRKINAENIKELFPNVYKHPEAFEENRELREQRRTEKLGIQATEKELMIHRNNRKIRAEIHRLDKNQVGHWDRRQKTTVAPLALEQKEYESKIDRLYSLMDRIIWNNEDTVITLETMHKSTPIQWNNDSLGNYYSTMDDFSVKKKYWLTRIKGGFKKFSEIVDSTDRNHQLENIYRFEISEYGKTDIEYLGQKPDTLEKLRQIMKSL